MDPEKDLQDDGALSRRVKTNLPIKLSSAIFYRIWSRVRGVNIFLWCLDEKIGWSIQRLKIERQTPVGKEEYRLVCGFSNGDLWPAPALWKAYLPTTFLSPSSKRPFVLEKFPVHCNTHSLAKLRDNCLGITFAWSLTNEVTVWKGSNSWRLKKPGQWSPEERWSQPILLSLLSFGLQTGSFWNGW